MWPFRKRAAVSPEVVTTRLGDSVEVRERHTLGIVIGTIGGRGLQQFVEWRLVPLVFINDGIIEEANARMEVLSAPTTEAEGPKE